MDAAWHSARSILGVRLDGIGELLMTTPALRALEEACGQRRLTLHLSPPPQTPRASWVFVDEVIALADRLRAGGARRSAPAASRHLARAGIARLGAPRGHRRRSAQHDRLFPAHAAPRRASRRTRDIRRTLSYAPIGSTRDVAFVCEAACCERRQAACPACKVSAYAGVRVAWRRRHELRAPINACARRRNGSALLPHGMAVA